MLAFPLPEHITSIKDDGEQEKARVRFVIQVAALYFSPGGAVSTLSKALGRHPSSLGNCISIGGPSAIALETTVNHPLFPKEVFAPTVFAPKE